MQDSLHAMKKMRNNAKYLSTKLILFCNPANITMENRLKYVVRWDVIFELYSKNKRFRQRTPKSSVLLTDKQDPSAVADLCYYYQAFYDMEYHGTGLWLEMTYLMLSAFFDKSLSPEDRIVNISIVRTVLITWKEAMTKLRARTKHMSTKYTFDDTLIALEGLQLYILLTAVNYKDQDITPWLFSSYACEQLFAFLRIGIHAGRRTNVAAKDVVSGMAKCNRSLELDAAGFSLMPQTVAHSRNRLLIPNPNPQKIFKGKDTSMARLKGAIREGVEQGRRLLRNHCDFDGEAFDSTDESDDESDEEYCIQGVDEPEEGAGIVTIDGELHHISSAVEVFLNDGKDRMPAQSRFRRFQGHKGSKISLDKPCPNRSNGGCKTLSIGGHAWFEVKQKTKPTPKTSKILKVRVRGQALFISYRRAVGNGSSVSCVPVNTVCVTHQSNYHVWLKSKIDNKLLDSQFVTKVLK